MLISLSLILFSMIFPFSWLWSVVRRRISFDSAFLPAFLLSLWLDAARGYPTHTHTHIHTINWTEQTNRTHCLTAVSAINQPNLYRSLVAKASVADCRKISCWRSSLSTPQPPIRSDLTNPSSRHIHRFPNSKATRHQWSPSLSCADSTPIRPTWHTSRPSTPRAEANRLSSVSSRSGRPKRRKISDPANLTVSFDYVDSFLIWNSCLVCFDFFCRSIDFALFSDAFTFSLLILWFPSPLVLLRVLLWRRRVDVLRQSALHATGPSVGRCHSRKKARGWSG